MGISYTSVVLALAFCNSSSAKFIIPSNKINAEQLSISAANELYGDRINPSKLSINSNSIDNDFNAHRRATRDTLLSLYRQKQLYKNLNRNLFESYFQTPMVESVNVRAGSTGFKKLVTNPYKDYKKSKSEVEARPIYKKHPGFHVTDSVNHLKYLVEKKPQDNDDNNNNLDDDTDNNFADSNSNSDNSFDSDSQAVSSVDDYTRQRRGEFAHKRDNAASSMDSDTLAVYNQLRANNVRI